MPARRFPPPVREQDAVVVCATAADYLRGFRARCLKYRLVIVTESAQALAGPQIEKKTRTAPPRPRNKAFGQASRLVRRPTNLRLLSELPADLPTKLFARAMLVRGRLRRTDSWC